MSIIDALNDGVNQLTKTVDAIQEDVQRLRIEMAELRARCVDQRSNSGATPAKQSTPTSQPPAQSTPAKAAPTGTAKKSTQ